MVVAFQVLMLVLLGSLLPLLAATAPVPEPAEFAAPLPEGVRAVWDLSNAFRETTPTRERICLNGLWRWQPAASSDAQAPDRHWGYFKVPGCWPGITDYIQKDSQTVFAHPHWKAQRLASLSAAWYERTLSVPKEWQGRRLSLRLEYLNSYAAVCVDGTNRGEIRFPGGTLDLTDHLRPGGTHTLSIFVAAMPLKGVMLSYADSNAAREVQGKVERRGLCGDVFLISEPAGPRITKVKLDTSVRRSEITLDAALQGLAAQGRYALRARISQGGRTIREWTSRAFAGSDVVDDRFAFSESWKPEALWDLHTPSHQYELTLSLLDADATVLDAYDRVPFGYREFWIEGRDFYLNGSRIFLCAVPLDNAQVSAATATYDGARESLERLKSIGINIVYTHNYGCEPGAHLGFEEILRAADDVGMLVALSQPHFSHYEWRAPEADRTNGYVRHAAYYTGVARAHPSLVAYAMSHNATGYEEDMNPDLIDGVADPRYPWSRSNAQQALRAEALVRQLDPTRIVYHHASGNLGSMHSINFYPNFAPVQELSDWFEHWATQGRKPLFTCEYGAPFTWDWTMYRGWYKGERSFGSAQVPWEFCIAEWNAQFFGDRAFRISPAEAADLRWEADKFRAGKLWHRWDYPHPVGSSIFDEQYPVMAEYLENNWRAFRTWGVSAISPWEYGHYWKLRDGVNKGRKELKVDWDHLQRPGPSPDYIDRQYERMDLAFERADWVPTVAAQALERHNRPLLAYLGGKPGQFTSKDHVFYPGETLEKQLIVINNSREPVTCTAQWALDLPEVMAGQTQFAVATGEQQRVPLRFDLPQTLAPGAYMLRASVRCGKAEMQSDAFTVHVIPRPSTPEMRGRIALFDPQGETGAWLRTLGVSIQPINAATDLAPFDILIVGKSALTIQGAAPDITRVRQGLKVVIFEQSADVLEKRFGFRVAEYGLRRLFPRVPDHPLLAGLSAEHWRDWRGQATLQPPRLRYELRPRYGPTVSWCAIPQTRLWRCGNRGNVASVLIEKPVCGDFLPVLDGGYSLQYSPLMEYREGQGLVMFCQLDVTGRTEAEPVTETLLRNLLGYVANWKPVPARTAVYVGDPAGKQHLESAGIVLTSYDGGALSSDQVLIAGPGAGRALRANSAALDVWLKAGGNLLGLGLDQTDADALPQVQVRFKRAEHIATFFEPNGLDSVFRGIGAADVHNRDPRALPLIASGATTIGNGVLAAASKPNMVFCQLVPWQFDQAKQSNLKRTFRRAAFSVNRLLANLGAAGVTPVLSRFHTPLGSAKPEQRWLTGLYLDQPEEWDDPYRFFRW